MKRTMSTIVLFVLLILTMVALTQIPVSDTSALHTTSEQSAVKYSTR